MLIDLKLLEPKAKKDINNILELKKDSDIVYLIELSDALPADKLKDVSESLTRVLEYDGIKAVITTSNTIKNIYEIKAKKDSDDL